MSVIQLGPYVEGEIPEPLVYAFQDRPGAVVDLTDGFTAEFVVSINGVETHLPATITDAANGTVEHVWLDGEIVAGKFQARFWVENGTNRYASDQFLSVIQRS